VASTQPDKPAPLPVVGIGASAGGIEALQQFFEAVPGDLGLAYVVIVHLAPDRKSDLPGILKRHTPMPVTQVGDHDKVDLAPDHVYVIAPNRKLEITDTVIGASRFEQPRGQRAAIDLFFRSLAATHGDGFAIVLSGSGSDGALGAKALKEAGGLVLVQDPSEAGHDGMPRSVISTGAADLVLPVRELAARLAELARDKHRIHRTLGLTGPEPQVDADDEAGLQGILELLKARTGHDFSKYKRNTVIRRVVRRLQLNHRSSLADYQNALRENPEEVSQLFNDLLISVTSFFRDPHAWEALAEKVIVPLIEQVPAGEQIRAWVPGCATGEEAYSLAMLFRETIEARQSGHDFILFGSDIDETALATAREGRYPAAIAADLTESRLQRFFHREDDHYRIASDVRDHVVFTTHNLLRDPPFSRLHLLTCRNLLIYLDRELQEQLMSAFHYACRSEAYLFLGVSETAEEKLFRAVDKRYRIYQARPLSAGKRRTLPDILFSGAGAPPRESWSRASPRKTAPDVVDAFESLAPPSVLVDDRWNVLHVSNSAGRFLLHQGGEPTQAVLGLVRPELQDELHNALHRAFETHRPKLSAFVPVRFDGAAARRIGVLAQWRAAGKTDAESALVTFLDAGDALEDETTLDDAPAADLLRSMRDKLRQAERRADHMRDDQHLANEDLRAANEELQSLNEEYRSTTEELETSKEELQSINEELQTVNQELKAKLEDVSRAHNDMKNLMAATDIPILFLNRDLTINRFTPQLTRIYNVQARDRGRPVADFTHHLAYGELLQDAREVLANLAPLERESTSDDGRFFIIRLRPYRTSEDKIDGVVITFVDITKLKQTEIGLRESEQQFRALVDASAQTVWTADMSGEFREDSPSWRAFTGQSLEEMKGFGWLDAVHPDDRAATTKLWRESLEQGSQFTTEYRLRHQSGNDYRWTSVRAVPMQAPRGNIRGWVGMNIDITSWRHAAHALRRADARKDEFLAMLGHELRNPLAAVRHTLEAMDQGELAGRAWEVIDRQSRHMHRLVNDLLDVERIKRGKLTLSRQPMDLCQCIEDVTAALRGQIAHAGVALELDLPPQDSVLVDADPERVAQMIDNLVRNSINHTDTGGRIKVAVRREAQQAAVMVEDTGVGIDADELPTLFEPYSQGSKGRSSKGLGLGLPLVKRLAEMHGGTIEVASEGPGAGSTFTLRLPITEVELASTPPCISQPEALRILVVDDQVDIADAFGAMLRTLGHQVATAYNGESALAAARRIRPEVAFLDLAMPGMDGFELAERLRQEYPAKLLSLVAVSGFGNNYAPDRAGVFGHRIVKPADLQAIIQVLNEAATSLDRAETAGLREAGAAEGP
jgi:two-component system, chemotaxis family, CheB/CheR fusion protein